MDRVFSHATMQALYEAARKVLEEGASPKLLRQPLKELDEMVELRESNCGQKVIETARNLHIDYEHDIDIDDATVVYHNETNGYWVMGWCFVPDRDEDDDEDDEDTEAADDQSRDGAGNQLPRGPDSSLPNAT